MLRSNMVGLWKKNESKCHRYLVKNVEEMPTCCV